VDYERFQTTLALCRTAAIKLLIRDAHDKFSFWSHGYQRPCPLVKLIRIALAIDSTIAYDLTCLRCEPARSQLNDEFTLDATTAYRDTVQAPIHAWIAAIEDSGR
jgi:hypothetical protein